MTKEPFEARELDVTRPTAARLYDYFLGGTAHYDVDKVFAERMFKFFPHLDAGSHHNRGFLQRACRYMAVECGIRQFIDIGSGIPTVGNTHHVVGEFVSDARVVYVDKDLEVVNQSYDLLLRENTVNVSIIEADLRYPESILDHPETRRLIDFGKPVGLLMGSVWLFISDDDRPYDLMACYRGRLASGSYVAMTHHSIDEAADEAKEMFTAVAQSYDETADPITLRGREQFTAFFDGLTIVEPGVVYAADWRTKEPVGRDDLARPLNYAAVARKP
jgi:hypothetical protein